MPVVVTTKSPENLHLIDWPIPKVLAFSTTRLPPKSNNNSLNITASSENIAVVGVVPSAFEFFNLGAHVGDSTSSVVNNRNTLLQFLPSETKIQWLEQVHGSDVAYIDKHNAIPIVADAAITCQKKLALAIMTADCLPILLADKNGGEIAAIHAGWRPLAANIIKKTISQMKTPIDDIVVWLGPCIGAQAFEVGEEVKKAFTNISAQFSVAFTPLANTPQTNYSDKYLADLVTIAQLQLKALGIKNFSAVNACTYTESDKYYSYRKEGKTGRMASIITLV